MTYQNTEQTNSAIFKPLGPIVASNAHEIRRKLESIIEAGAREITFDMADVEEIDSLGLSVIIGVYMTLTRLEGNLSVINASDEIYELFVNMRLDKRFSVTRAGDA